MTGSEGFMRFSRRTLFSRWLPGLAGSAAASAMVTASADAAEPAVQKVVYHLSEPTRVQFVLGNILNHIEGKGGPDKVRIVLVIHGPALDAFISAKASPDIMRQVEARGRDGVDFVACGNTMKAKQVDIDDLLGGFSVAREGGVVRIADLQEQGYLYLRP
jgi:intracellular sulfur oxidation DsrE/DsrF family protein